MNPEDANLGSLLFDVQSQKRFLMKIHNRVKNSFEKIKDYNSTVFFDRGNSVVFNDVDTNSKVISRDMTLADIRRKTIQPPTLDKSRDDVLRLLEWAIETPECSPNTITYFVILSLHFVPETHTIVCRSTEKNLADAYLVDFNHRIQAKLCGSDELEAYTPLELIASERDFFNRLQTSDYITSH